MEDKFFLDTLKRASDKSNEYYEEYHDAFGVNINVYSDVGVSKQVDKISFKNIKVIKALQYRDGGIDSIEEDESFGLFSFDGGYAILYIRYGWNYTWGWTNTTLEVMYTNNYNLFDKACLIDDVRPHLIDIKVQMSLEEDFEEN
jgi:hypothetical protein